ncbi:MAG: ABC transporter substrate-binding protein [Clostridiales bacterium]|jgi:ABC-type nitrate/sulfonate/bicarbonate transport system substrate-binding protein|nr:ABC transporter substrate-binding protein [Clostridiales bacterium]
MIHKIILAALSTLLLFTGCASSAASPSPAPDLGAGNAVSIGEGSASDPAPEKELFNLRIVTQTAFNELNVADALGFFRDEGIQVEYTGVLAKGVTEYQLIEQGAIDAFTTGHPPNVAQARMAGIKVKCVSPGMIDDPAFPHIRYLVKPDSPIQSLEEAVGKKVTISGISGCTSGYVQYYLKSKGLDPESVEFVVITDSDAILSLGEGLTDLAVSHPPFAGKAVASGAAREILTSWDIFHSPGAGLSVRGFSEDFIEQHPDVVQGFVNALYRAHLWINANLDEAKQIVAYFFDLEPTDLSSFLYDESKEVTEDYVRQWFDICEEIGLWEQDAIAPAEIIDNSFTPKEPPASDADLHWDGPAA